MSESTEPMVPAGKSGARWPGSVRWVAAAGLAAATPKCLLCVLGTAGLAAGTGWFGPELCGEAADPRVPTLVVLAGLLAGIGVAIALHRGGKRSSSTRGVRKAPGRSLG